MKTTFVLWIDENMKEARKEEVDNALNLSPTVGYGRPIGTRWHLHINVYGNTPRICFYFHESLTESKRDVARRRFKQTIPSKFFDE